MKKLIFIAALFFISPSIFAETKYPDAPLGLKWGMTAAELESKAGAKFLTKEDDENISVYSLKSPPIPLPEFTTYLVYVHKDLGAMRILMVEPIKSDIYGIKGKKEYFKYKEALINKYGQPDSSKEYTGREYYKSSNEFYLCFSYPGCGLFYTSFFKDHITMFLSDGIGKENGSLSITYESEQYTKYKEDKENEKKNNIKKGL